METFRIRHFLERVIDGVKFDRPLEDVIRDLRDTFPTEAKELSWALEVGSRSFDQMLETHPFMGVGLPSALAATNWRAPSESWIIIAQLISLAKNSGLSLPVLFEPVLEEMRKSNVNFALAYKTVFSEQIKPSHQVWQNSMLKRFKLIA